MNKELIEEITAGRDDPFIAHGTNGANPFSCPPEGESGAPASPASPRDVAEQRARQTLRRLKGMAAVETDSVDECTVDLLAGQSKHVLELLEQEWLTCKPGWPTASSCAALIEQIERRLAPARRDF
jgi:hypothetical protein